MLGRRFVVALFLIGVVVAGIWVVGLLLHKGLDWAVKFSAIAAVVLAITGPLVPPVGRVAHWLRKPQPPTPEEIISARNNLQATLSGAWSEKGSEVYEYLPMRVRFAPWTEAVGSQGPDDAARVDAPATEQSQAGDFDSVADAFSREPRYRRVVLGEAGAGKTVLVTELQRKLVEVPKPGDPVPVIVPAAAWRPDRQSLLDWLGERLAADYGWLPVTHARALVARGMVLPILDGLDEMPRSLQPVAIARINKHHMYRPLVVTSREEEYRTAAGQNRVGVKGSEVVVVQPLLSADTRRYLDPTGSGGWAEVLGEMDADGGALARVLANPLMLWLARVEYEGKSPENLTLFGSSRSIELYLLDEFVPTVYAADSGQPTAGQFRCTAQQAKRWLGHLGAPVLAWWQIDDVAGRWWRRLGIGLRAAVLCTLAVKLGIWVLERHGDWRHSAYSGTIDVDNLLLGGSVGRRLQPTIHTLGINVKGPARNDLVSISHAIQDFAHQSLIILAAVLFVIGVALWRSLGSRLYPLRLQFRAAAVLRVLIRCCALFIAAALAALLLLYLTHWPVSTAEFFSSRSTWIALLAVSLLGLISLPGSFTTRSETSGNLSPNESLRLDRQADLFVTVLRRSAVGVAVWLFCGAQIAVAYAVYAITATAIAVFAGGQNSYASRCYTDAHMWLAVQGWAPWRTMDFLADANRRGVLRQVGAAYQFRHGRLLEQVRSWRSGPAWLDEWKRRLGKLTNRARERLGWHEDTSYEIGKDVSYHWWSAQSGRDAVLPQFADDLDNLACQKWWSDEQKRAAALRDLLDDYQRVAETDPATFKPGLARALKDSASAFSWNEALRMSGKAVDCYRELAQTDPAAFLPGLAEAAGDLAVRLSQLDRLEEARCLIRDVVNTARRLAKGDPATFLPVLAYSLSDLSRVLWASQAKESVSAQIEAAAIYRERTTAYPAKFARSLTSSLDILVSMFKALRSRQEELAAIRQALDAYRERAERIAEIRRQVAESDLAVLSQYRREPTSVERLFSRTRSDQVKKILTAAGRAAAACGELAESQPTEFLPDLAEAANGLAAELKSRGKRRAARVLAEEARRIRSQYRRSVDVARREAEEVRPLDAMDRLALRLWKLGEQQEALTAGQMSHELAPARRTGAATSNLRHSSFARLLFRIREENEVRSWKENARFWRNKVQNPTLKQKAKKDPRARRDLASAQHELAVALEGQSDALDTLVFRREVAGRTADAVAAMQKANNTRQEAARIMHEKSSEPLPSDISGLPKSSGTLALLLKESAGGGASDRGLPDQRDTSPVAGTLHRPAPGSDLTQSGDPPEDARTG